MNIRAKRYNLTNSLVKAAEADYLQNSMVVKDISTMKELRTILKTDASELQKHELVVKMQNELTQVRDVLHSKGIAYSGSFTISTNTDSKGNFWLNVNLFRTTKSQPASTPEEAVVRLLAIQ